MVSSGARGSKFRTQQWIYESDEMEMNCCGKGAEQPLFARLGSFAHAANAWRSQQKLSSGGRVEGSPRPHDSVRVAEDQLFPVQLLPGGINGLNDRVAGVPVAAFVGLQP